MDLSKLTLTQIKNGCRFDKEKGCFLCNYCEKEFENGQVFSFGGNYYLPEHAVVKHIEEEHGGNFNALVNSDTKYNTLTQNQKELLAMFNEGVTDNEISKKLGVSASTIRRQKFTFREKSKQAKLYLAIFENVFHDKPSNNEDIIPIHNNARYYDDRYVITEQEQEHVISTFFLSINPLKLKLFSPKEKNKVIILRKILEQFEYGRFYTEKEVNQILKNIYDDYTTIRRYLVMYGYMDREKDCSSYWVKP